MKRIIALAMSALLAASAVAIPVSAEPVVPLPNIEWSQQARPVSAEELAQVRGQNPEEVSSTPIEEADVQTAQGSIAPAVIEEALHLANEAAADSKLQVEPPVPAQITASTVILEYREGYEYRVYRSSGSGSWKTSNVFTGLAENRNYLCQQRLAGKPETESETLWIRTKDRTPCCITPVKPIIDTLAGTFIYLEELEGYEYRIDDKTWQNVGNFWNLEPGTEYTIYQRVKETGEEYASEPSELRVKTPVAGPSADTNLNLVAQYINDNGFLDDNNIPTIAYSVPVNDTNEYYFVMSYHTYQLHCNLFNVSQDEYFLAFDTSFDMPTSGHMFPECDMQLVSEGYCIDQVHAWADTVYVEDYRDYQLDVYHDECNYMTDDDISQMVNTSVALLIGFWDEMIYTELGFGVKGLGFISYDGYGELFCSPGASYHIGEAVEAGYREPGCIIDGKEANQYCSVCNVQIKSGDDIPAKGGHQYDNDCDRDCNVCGEQRCTRHVYSFACDVRCDVCSTVRTDPLDGHTFDANRLCTKCGHKGYLIGDISGDGKVNMGDISRVYAHTRGTTLLMDADALTAADTNSDGKINLGDTSRILAHITGKKPLW